MLLDAIGQSLVGTAGAGLIASLFEGTTVTLCKCKSCGYGNFDIILDHFPRICHLHLHPTRAVCCALPGAYADWLLIGAWNPLL